MDLRSKKKTKISLIIIVTLVIGFIVVYLFKKKDSVFCSDSECDSYACQNIPNVKKFDCFPRGVANRDECLKRKCCWAEANDEYVPKCFYREESKSYMVVERSKTFHGERLSLNLTSKSIYPKDVPLLRVEIFHETKSRLHVKITDAVNRRYEPQYPQVPSSNGQVDTSLYSVAVQENPFGFAIIRNDTGTVIFDTRNTGRFTYADQFLQLSALIPSKYLYGLGEQRNNFSLNTNWEYITLFNHDVSPRDKLNLYSSHPFYLSMEDDGSSHGVFLLNSNAMDIILQPAPAITYRVIGGVLDFYFFMGPTPSDVIKQYTEVIGKPFLPPYWSLGFHLCRFGLPTLNDTIKIWKRNWDAGLPFDVQWNDIEYMERYNDFTVSSNYSELPQFVDRIHKLGMKHVVIIDPGIASKEPPGTYPPYDLGLKKDIFIKNSSNFPLEGQVWNKNGGTVFPDFTSPNIISYWTEMLDSLHKKINYDGIWLDMNEISNFVNGSVNGCGWKNDSLNHPPYVPNVHGGDLNYMTLCMSAKHYAGSHYDLHNLYGYTEAIVTALALKNVLHKRPFVLTRATSPGSGHFSAHWTGDDFSTWDDMKHSVADIMSFNLFGIPMVGADICGNNYNTTKELCRRWSQLGAFYTFSRNHNTDDAIDQDPAAMGIIESTTKALNFRYKLLPYLYTLFWNAYKEGDTVIRPLFFEFPEDVKTYTENTQFLWGPAFLIVPVLIEGETSVTSYFPKDTWFDAYTLKEVRSDGQNITINAPKDYIPLFFRAGYIIPFQDPSQTTTKSRKNKFGLYVASNETGQAYGTLFWDDGESNDIFGEYQCNMLRFELNNSTLSGIPFHWGYKTTMILGTVHVMGIHGIVNQVYVNDKPHMFIKKEKTINITSLEIDLSTTFVIRWT